VQLAAEHGGQAQPDAQPDQDEVAGIGGGARGALGHRREVHVVLDDDRLVQDAAQRVQRAFVPRGQVHRQPRVAGSRVDHTRTGDHQRAEPGQIHPGAGAGSLDDPADQFGRVVGTVRVNVHVGYPAAGDVGHCGADQVEVHVQARHVGAGRDDRVQRGVGAAIPGLLPHDRHQAPLLQPRQHLRHRNLGHSGVLADLGSGQRLAAQQEVEGGPVVQLAQQARRTRPGARFAR